MPLGLLTFIKALDESDLYKDYENMGSAPKLDLPNGTFVCLAFLSFPSKCMELDTLSYLSLFQDGLSPRKWSKIIKMLPSLVGGSTVMSGNPLSPHKGDQTESWL